MSDHPKSPKNPFNFNAKTEEERKAAQKNKGQVTNKTDTLRFTINGTQGGRANVEIEEGGKKTKATFEPEKSNMVWHRIIDGGPNKNGLTFELTLKDEIPSCSLMTATLSKWIFAKMEFCSLALIMDGKGSHG